MNNLINYKFEGRDLKKAVVVLPGEKMDLETISVFNDPRQKGEVVVKAVVAGGGELNLKGLIKINKGADGVEAFLRQNVLLLGKKATAVAVPELEIECNEVKASHAAFVGQVDTEEVFYLQSRGMTEAEAKRMIVGAFLEEVFDSMEEGEAKLVKEKLEKL